MKKKATLFCLLIILVSLVLGFQNNLFAQDPDTLDVAQGFETLNLAIEGDTTDTGELKNLNRVYRLERGGYYLLNGAVRGNSGAVLRLVAAKGDGPRPLLIPAVDETGAADRALRPRGDVTAKGLYITGIDNLGNMAEKNMFRLDGNGARAIVDDCFLDYDGQSFFRMNSEDQKLYLTNSVLRNSMDIASPGNGRFIDTRSNTQDTIFFQNCTLYMGTGDMLRAAGGIIKNVTFDHITLYQADGEADIEKAINCRVTNSLFIDWGFEGEIYPSVGPPDSINNGLIQIDTLAAPELATEDQRVYTIKNNVYGWTPELTAWFDNIDTVKAWVWHDVRAQRFIDVYPNMASENNIMEYPEFTDAPAPEPLITYIQHRYDTNFSDENNPDPRADRNGRSALADDPTTFGPAADEFDFDYSTSSQAYTHAEGGFPVGDLNWFPDKKAEWESSMVSVEMRRDNSPVPDHFSLEQNYPNPFNPVTTIAFKLNKAEKVTLTIYNSLGQKVRTLVKNKSCAAGNYSMNWDGRNDSGNLMASGVYLYRLQAGDQMQMRKMILMK